MRISVCLSAVLVVLRFMLRKAVPLHEAVLPPVSALIFFFSSNFPVCLRSPSPHPLFDQEACSKSPLILQNQPAASHNDHRATLGPNFLFISFFQFTNQDCPWNVKQFTDSPNFLPIFVREIHHFGYAYSLLRSRFFGLAQIDDIAFCIVQASKSNLFDWSVHLLWRSSYLLNGFNWFGDGLSASEKHFHASRAATPSSPTDGLSITTL